MEQANNCLQYLAGTVDFGITYTNDKSELYSVFTDLNQIVAFSDADFAGCLDTAKSTSGCVVMMNNGGLYWKSKRQTTVAISTSVAETLALAKATIAVRHLRQTLADLNTMQTGPTVIYVDNRAAILVNEGGDLLHETAKHVAVQNMMIKEAFSKGIIVMIYTKTGKQHADIFTKALNGPVFRYHRDMIMFRSQDSDSQRVCLTIIEKEKTIKQEKIIAASESLREELIAWLWTRFCVQLDSNRKHEVARCDDRIRTLKRYEKGALIRCLRSF